MSNNQISTNITPSTKNRLTKILTALNENLYEREEVIRLALLTTIAGESIFLLGPPGVAKSLVSRRIKEVFRDGESFEYLMNRFSTPDEIFGPIAISKLKNEDKYERITDKYLPSADIVFLDEIWKAGPSIQNALLTVINEKIYRNGNQEIKIPLKGLLSASNELPAEDEGLGALWDRFIIRYFVENIADTNNFHQFLTSKNSTFEVNIDYDIKISDHEYYQWQEAIDNINVSEEALNVIDVIRHYIKRYNALEETKHPLYVSDRRWKKIIRILKTSAFLNERDTIDLMDCFLISHMIWDDVPQISVVSDFINDAIRNHGFALKYKLGMYTEEITNLERDIIKWTQETREVGYLAPQELSLNNSTYYFIEDPKLFLKDRYNTFCRNIKKAHWDALGYEFQPVELFNNNNEPAEFFSDREPIAKKVSDNEIQIALRYKYNNGAEFNEVFKFVSERKIKSETISKRPPQSIIDRWNEQVARITSSIEKTIHDIESYKRDTFATLKDNIFVDLANSELVEENINNTISNFFIERKRISELKENYDKLS